MMVWGVCLYVCMRMWLYTVMVIGQVTLIPPENSGRIRKQKERRNLRQFDLRAVGVSGGAGMSPSGTSGTTSGGDQRTRDGGGEGSSRPASSLGTARAGFRSEGGGGGGSSSRANEGRLGAQGRMDGLSSPIRDPRRTREHIEGWDDLIFDRLSFILRF